MKKKIVYVEPHDLIEIRVCDPVFEEGANKGSWDQSLNPASILIEVDGYDSLSVISLYTHVSRNLGFGKKKSMETIK